MTSINNEVMKLVKSSQLDEEEGVLMYAFMAKRQKDEKNKAILEKMSSDEKMHAKVWESISNEKIKPNPIKIGFMKLVTILLGFTFMVKKMQRNEQLTIEGYDLLAKEFEHTARIVEDERRHEKELYAMLDEERLHYVGAMVLGLNDALVELTGAIAGVTFALQDTKLVAMTGIITGISATLSMAASNYLAERANGNENAIKSSFYTGVAYIVAVGLMVLPYLLLPSEMYGTAFACMIATVLFIILFFNYYISVAKDEPFVKRFLEMAIISLSVAAISFVIGLLAKQFLGIDTL
ncbi:VIT1/CCC1 transporter family protein [Anaerorhabdus furcosa]|uniref:Predicted Fe2+/Mn2+ transporter, VIT1/CCC1 family n=1 Tax=Anaerorhabdus furcosa TaxID=118967 RepID=A0A1T4KQE9_9FIRM|nr:VIT1/CCC1 transporter family protein [Anaerorhabdus furcosa]SJZ44557.1 Predicted Fe2+/Mn2+ transporter, VIT1/CCC1 family [Anaerorhabdus furcosa]